MLVIVYFAHCQGFLYALMSDLLEDKQCSSVGGFDVPNLYPSPTSFLAIMLRVLSRFCMHLARLWCLLVFSGSEQVTRTFGAISGDFVGQEVDSCDRELSFEKK